MTRNIKVLFLFRTHIVNQRVNNFIDRKDMEFTKNSEQKILQEMYDEDGLTDTSL